MAVERFVDYRGRTVELTEERWAHIVGGHDEMAARRSAIIDAVAAPDRVTRDRQIHRAECYYRTLKGRLMVRVVVIYRPTPHGWEGEILTAHPIKGVEPKEEALWP